MTIWAFLAAVMSRRNTVILLQFRVTDEGGSGPTRNWAELDESLQRRRKKREKRIKNKLCNNNKLGHCLDRLTGGSVCVCVCFFFKSCLVIMY